MAPEASNPSWREGMAGHHGRSWKLADCIFIHAQKTEKGDRKWGETKLSSPIPVVGFLQQCSTSYRVHNQLGTKCSDTCAHG